MSSNSLARTALYSERISLHLEVYSVLPVVVCLLACGYLSRRWMQMASTKRLFPGDDAGDPADKKHLKGQERYYDDIV